MEKLLNFHQLVTSNMIRRLPFPVGSSLQKKMAINVLRLLLGWMSRIYTVDGTYGLTTAVLGCI